MAGCSGGCQRDYRVITLDVLELAAQTPDRDLAESLRQLLIAYSALVRCKEPSSATSADHNGPPKRSADTGQRMPRKPERAVSPQPTTAIKPDYRDRSRIVANASD